MPRLHPRVLTVNAAHAELRSYLVDLQERHDLTDIEMVRMLLDCTHSSTKWILRAERHPDDPDKKADEA